MENKKLMKVSDFEQPSAYKGTIINAKWETKETPWGKVEQLHLEIKPVDFEVKGQTGVMHEWYKYSPSKTSVWFQFIKALSDCGIAIDDIKELNGKTFYWTNSEYKYKDKDGTEHVKVIKLPIQPDNEEIDEEINEEINEESNKKVEDFEKTTENSFDEKIQIQFIQQLKEGMTKPQIKEFCDNYHINYKELSEFMNIHLKQGEIEHNGDIYKWILG
jgi:DNA-binding transcriptional MerR regulator